MNEGEFNRNAQIPPITTGFYFPEVKTGNRPRVRILKDEIYHVEHTAEDVAEGFASYDEYVIGSKDVFFANYPDFIKLTLAESTANPRTEIFVNPDIIEFISYWPSAKPAVMLSINPTDIHEYWNLESKPRIDDARIIDIFIHNPHDNRFEGRYHMNKAFLRSMIEIGEIPKGTNFVLAENLLSNDRVLNNLTRQTNARAPRYEG